MRLPPRRTAFNDVGIQPSVGSRRKLAGASCCKKCTASKRRLLVTYRASNSQQMPSRKMASVTYQRRGKPGRWKALVAGGADLAFDRSLQHALVMTGSPTLAAGLTAGLGPVHRCGPLSEFRPAPARSAVPVLQRKTAHPKRPESSPDHHRRPCHVPPPGGPSLSGPNPAHFQPGEHCALGVASLRRRH